MSDTNTSGTEMVDYFSMLPHPLIHHILSFLPFDDIVRTCTLSKDWHRIWLTYPSVEFHFDFCVYTRQGFFAHMQNSLAQCFGRKACIKNFSPSICYPAIEILAPNLDHWLRLAMKKNISKLRLSIGRFWDYIRPSLVLYSIPEEVLVANTLEVLDLHQCNLKKDRFGSVNLPRLRKLSLNRCQFVGASLLQKIVSACPIVEHISILRCIGVGHFLFVSCKPKLKYFKVDRCEPELEKIEIDAPNLHTLSYNSSYKVCAIEMSIWSSVKELELGHAMVHLLSSFSLEELAPSAPTYSENIMFLGSWCSSLLRFNRKNNKKKDLIAGDTTSSGTNKVDYFSKLPDPIIHHIFSFLPIDDVARTSILSKEWHRIWLSYPTVDYHFDFCITKRVGFYGL
nr:F-box protein At5g03100-like isoform X1 [Ipomoea batatas]